MVTRIKTRICPSPTGKLHIGNLRTAIFNWLLARQKGGVFLLRIEDTDLTRSDPAYSQSMKEDLHWMMMQWDEGPDVGGDAGPYYQSERQAIYDHYYRILESSHHAYPCYCSEEELELARKLQRAAGKPPRYPGTCRHLGEEARRQREAEGCKPTLRFRVPEQGEIQFHDLVHGEQVFKCVDLGDFIIRRADGTSPFMFCNAIDDSLMGVTHALRGDDHLSNTPRQLMILEALNLRKPQYGHIALILGDDQAPLSKRLGSLSIAALRDQGYLPLALLNYLSRLGHSYSADKWMSAEELAKNFNMASLSKSPAHFDETQLNYWQHEAVLHADPKDLLDWLKSHGLSVSKENQEKFIQVIQPNITFPKEAIHWAEIIYGKHFKLPPAILQELAEVPKAYWSALSLAIENHHEDFAAVMETVKTQTGIKGKKLFHPLRLALTGQTEGPDLSQLFQLLGKEELKRRVEKFLV